MDLNVHRLARTCGRYDDFVDHAAQAFEDDVAGLAFAHAVQVLAQFLDQLAIAISRGWVEDNGLVVDGQQIGLTAQLVVIGLEAAEPLNQCIGGATFDHEVDQAFNLPVEIGQAVGERVALIVLRLGQLATGGMILGHVFGDEFRIGQIGIERFEDAIFDMDARDAAPVLAIAALAVARAADAVIAHDGVTRPAATAFGEAREEMPRLRLGRALHRRALDLAGAGQSEHCPVHDGQMRHLGPLPFRFRIEP